MEFPDSVKWHMLRGVAWIFASMFEVAQEFSDIVKTQCTERTLTRGVGCVGRFGSFVWAAVCGPELGGIDADRSETWLIFQHYIFFEVHTIYTLLHCSNIKLMVYS